MAELKVGVIGAAGRMGSEACRAVDADPSLSLVVRVGRADSLEGLVDSGAEVAVDFTTPDSVKDNASFCLRNHIRTVIGTTGLSADDLTELEKLAREHRVGCFLAPNFAIGAVLMMRFAAEAAPYFDVAEVIERHHERKLDAPSGTARRTAELMNQARAESWSDLPQGEETVERVRGGDAGGVRLHSVRMPGSVAHQEVILGCQGQALTIRHDSIDRSSFMPGLVLAIKRVSEFDGLVVGLENLLDL